MKIYPTILALTFLASGVFVSSHAQLVHLSFEANEENASYYLRGDRFMFYPWDTVGTGGLTSLLRLDIYYDLNAPQIRPPDEMGASYGLSDPSKNFFRLRYHAQNVDQPFDIVRPLRGITVGESALYTGWQGNESERFELNLPFEAPISVDYALPVPPFPEFLALSGPHMILTGSADLFELQGLLEGRISARFDTVQAEIIPAFTPVPEPSTYGIGALLAIGAALWSRRRKSNSDRQPQLAS
jgi:hypothetical protein